MAKLLVQSVKCRTCGHVNDFDFRFCQQCGYKRKFITTPIMHQCDAVINLDEMDTRLQQLLSL